MHQSFPVIITIRIKHEIMFLLDVIFNENTRLQRENRYNMTYSFLTRISCM